MINDLAAYCSSQRDWLLEFIEALVAIESPSDDLQAVNRCGAELASRLTALGATITRATPSTAGDHLRASFGAGDRQVLLLGHFDTVWPIGQLQRMPLKRDGGRLHGPGVFDMKAGIGLATLATRALLAQGALDRARIVMLWTTDEEIGSTTSRALIEAEAVKSDAVLVLEPSLPGGALKTSRKGVGQFELVVTGVSAHAGLDPGRGISAIHELARQVLDIEKLQHLDRGISVNVGIVRGGSRANVVAAEARATVDARAVTIADAREIEHAMKSLKPHLKGAGVHVNGGFDRPPLERSPSVVKLFEMARGVAREMGTDLAEGSAGGGSDGNFTAAVGVPTLDGLGAVGDGAHALDEHVVIDALAPRAALIAGLLGRLCSSSFGVPGSRAD
ncbi:MAG: M20 family metallopeptidase [Acidobacteriota bacterium]|nr:M20 family metallopeptidase [Acidobacteriota bacterium]